MLGFSRCASLAACLSLTLVPAAARSQQAGAPMAGSACGQPAATTSLRVGAVLGTSEVDGVPHSRTVLDMNAIVATTNGAVAGTAGLVTIGWVYRDDQHNFWFQKVTDAPLDLSLGGSPLRDIIARSFGVPRAIGPAALPMGIGPGDLDAHLLAAPCFALGDRFYPNEITPPKPP